MAFDGDTLGLVTYVDDLVTPPVSVSPGTVLYRWFACRTYVGGYTWENLAWGLGKGEVQNPSCVEVGVEREWV